MNNSHTANGTSKQEFKYIGKPRKLIDGLEKVTGHAKYAGDVKLPGMLHIRPILAQVANATILSIDTEDAKALPGVVAIYTADDLPVSKKVITSRTSSVLAKERTLWVGQPIAVVVAESEAIATDAAELVYVDLDAQDAVVDLMQAISQGAPKVWPNGFPTADDDGDLSSLHGNTEEAEEVDDDALNNIQAQNHFERGDVEAGFAESDVIVERRYHINSHHQGYMEPHAVVVDPDPLGRGATIYTATQGMFDVRNALAAQFDLPAHAIVLKPMVFGGGFGAKYGTFEPLALAVALKQRQPIRYVASRSEDFLTSTPAPEAIIDIKTGAKKDGTVTAIEGTIYHNNAVFAFNLGGLIARIVGGTYKWQHVNLQVYEVNTFTTPVGAYRAPGAPQATFAIEGNMDEMAAQLGADPLEFRYDNAVETGGLTGTGQPWATTIGMKDVLAKAREHPLWKNRKPGDGIGMAVGGWPNFYGNADATCRVDSDGRVRVETGIVDISGSKSALVLVAAEALGVKPEDVEMAQGDTTGAFGPGSGGSKVTYTMATAINEAAQDANRQLLEIASDEFEASAEDIEIVDGMARVRGVPDKTISVGRLAQIGQSRPGKLPVVGKGQSSLEQAGPGFVVHMIQVGIDKSSAEIKPIKYVAIQDVGFAINPMTVQGQMQGGAVQGLGIGMYERLVYGEDGQLLTGTFMDYTMPRSDNTPDIETIIVETPNPLGLHGARGMAEPPLTAGPAALASAVRDATGISLTEAPIRPEMLWNAMQEERES